MTKVVNIYHVPKDWESNPEYVYIGRGRYGERSEWGNPFRLDDDVDRATVLKHYIKWLEEQLFSDPNLRNRIRGLKGKYLVCFCAPKLCHGDILKLLAETL